MHDNPDLEAEQNYVERAYRRLLELKSTIREMMEAALSVPRGGTHQARAERDVMVRQSLSRLEQLEIGDQALVFGGLDYANPFGTVSSYHIGRLAVADEDMEPLVVDWRAPVAEPFYRATGKNPMDLARRRHFGIDHGRVFSIEDELFSGDSDEEGYASKGFSLSGPGALFAAVTRSRTGRMHDIVATIQAQQDEVIRAPLGDTLVVQGGPGTGKTAIALHRAAYLLYTHRIRLERQGVLVLAPSRIFARYIDQVLPSLGETGVEITTLEGLAGIAAAESPESPEESALKGDLRMSDLIVKAVHDRQRPLRKPEDIVIGAFSVSLGPGDTAEAVRIAKRRGGTHNHRRRFVESFLAVRVADKYLEKRDTRLEEDLDSDDVLNAAIESAAESEDPSEIKRQLARRVRRDPAFQRVVQRVWPKLTPESLLGDLFTHLPLLKLAGHGLLSEDEIAILQRSNGESGWSRSDLVLLNEARFVLGDARKNEDDGGDERGYGHIIVDEAQDLSPMAARMIGRHSLSGSMTILGDIGQATSVFGNRSWSEIVQPLVKSKGFNQVELKINYRTPREVMDVANALLASYSPGLAPAEAIRRSGNPIEIHRIGPGRYEQDVVEVAKRELSLVAPGTVALIVAEPLKECLSKVLANAGVEAGPGLDSEISVLGVNDAKGLEFDSVIVSGIDYYCSSITENPHRLYIAMTRTTNRLVILDNKDVPDWFVDLVLHRIP